MGPTLKHDHPLFASGVPPQCLFSPCTIFPFLRLFGVVSGDNLTLFQASHTMLFPISFLSEREHTSKLHALVHTSSPHPLSPIVSPVTLTHTPTFSSSTPDTLFLGFPVSFRTFFCWNDNLFS